MTRSGRIALLLLVLLAGGSCASAPVVAPQVSAPRVSADLVADIQERTFRYFWDLAQPENGLIPDRWATPSFSSVAAGGFGPRAHPIRVERGWVTREEARRRVLKTLRFLESAPQGSEPRGRTSYKGF